MNLRLRTTLLLLILTALLPRPAIAQEPFADLWQGLTATFHLAGDEGPENLIWIRGGECYSHDSIQAMSGVREIRSYCPADGSEELIFAPESHTFPDSGLPFDYESYTWSADERFLLFRTNVRSVWRYSGLADYYLFSMEDQEISPVAESAFTAEISPDGERVGFVLDGEIHVLEIETGEKRRLTHDAQEKLYNGRFGWVYEEEFGQVQAWKWSPDSRHIAYWQSDERHVERFISTDFEGIYPSYTDMPYPKAGEENPHVRIGVVDVGSGENRWVEPDAGEGYLARIY